MKFTFVDNGEETVIEVSDEDCNISYINLELEEEKDEDKTEESEEAN